MKVCPRCDTDKVETIFTSPVVGCWEVYTCPVCQFMWRSTERSEIIDPKKYSKTFKINPEKISEYKELPPIAARRNE